MSVAVTYQICVLILYMSYIILTRINIIYFGLTVFSYSKLPILVTYKKLMENLNKI